MPPYVHWNQAPPKGQQVPEQDTPRNFSSNTGIYFNTQAAQSHSKRINIS